MPSPFILLVDFDARSLAAMRKLFEGAGYTVRTASNGKEVEAILQQGNPAAIVMEPMIPGHDGFRLCASFKRGSEAPIPVVIASRIYRGPRYRNMAREAGADAYLERPQQDEQLIPTIARFISANPVDQVEEIAVPEESVPEFDLQILGDPVFASVTDDSFAASLPPSVAPTATPIAPTIAAPPTPRAESAAAMQRSAAEFFSAAGGFTKRHDQQSESAALDDFSDDDIDDAFGRTFGDPAPRAATPAPIAAADAEPIALDEEEDSEPAFFNAGLAAAAGASAGSAPIVPSREDHAIEFKPISNFQYEESSRKAIPALEEIEAAIEFAELEPASTPEVEAAGIERSSIGKTSDSPFGYDMSDMAPEAPIASSQLEFAIPAAAVSRAEPSARSSAQIAAEKIAPEPMAASGSDEPAADLSELDRLFEQAFSGAEPGAVPTASPQVVPAMAAVSPRSNQQRGYTGESLADPALEPEQEFSGPPPFTSGSREIPEGLRGMDSSTADLLHSLEELESSLPPITPEEVRRWSGAVEGEQSESLGSGSFSLVEEVPPRPDDERTLEEVIASLNLEKSEAKPGAQQPIAADPPASEAIGAPESFIEPLASGVIASESPRMHSGPHDPLQDQELVSARHGVAGHLNKQEIAERSNSGRWLKWLKLAIGGLLFGSAALYGTQRLLGGAESAPSAQISALDRKSPDRSTASFLPRHQDRQDQSAAPAPVSQEPTRVAVASRRAMPRSATPAALPKSGGASPDAEPAAGSRPLPRAPATAASGVIVGGSSRPAIDVQRPAPEAAAQIAAPEAGPPLTPVAVVDRQPDLDESKLRIEPTPAPAPAAHAEDPVAITELDEPPRLIESSLPALTEEAAQANVRGRVFLNLLIGTDGLVREVRVMIDPGFGLGDAARRAAHDWRYSIPKKGGVPTRVWKTEVIEFQPDVP